MASAAQTGREAAVGANRALLIGAAVSVLTLGGGAALAVAFLPERPSTVPRDAEQLRLDLDRTSVRFHEALLHDLARLGPDFVEALKDLEGEEERASSIAATLLEDAREERIDGPPTIAPDLTRFGAPRLPSEDGRLVYLIALFEHQETRRAREIPYEVHAFEARSLGFGGRLSPEVRPEADVLRALAYARLGLCDLTERAVADGERHDAVDTRPAGVLDPALVTALDGIGPFLARGALACCALTQDDHETASRELRAALASAGDVLSPDRARFLEAWAALLGDDRPAAESALADVSEEALAQDDIRRLRTLRDALARDGGDGVRDALFRKSDSRWLGTVVVEVLREALGAVPPDEAREAARRLVEAESLLIEAARDRDALFDHGVKAGGAMIGRL
ncbi:MAG: hypothetical protein AAF447_03140 [Myxococcota bacterium]